MCCKILLFSTLESNWQQFHFQGITRDQLGREQQLRISLRKNYCYFPQSNTLLTNFCHLYWPQKSRDWHTQPEINNKNNDVDNNVYEDLRTATTNNMKLRTGLLFFFECLGRTTHLLIYVQLFYVQISAQNMYTKNIVFPVNWFKRIPLSFALRWVYCNFLKILCLNVPYINFSFYFFSILYHGSVGKVLLLKIYM